MRNIENRLALAWLGATMAVAGWCSTAGGAVIVIHPSQDNSIYSESNSSNALGGLFAGETQDQALRRALLKFSIAGSGIPAGATITSVSLGLTQTKIGPGTSATFELHRLSSAWGEGTSSGTGSGGLATAGDATWNYRLYSTSLWTSPGGDFGSTSGTATIGTTVPSLYTFASQSGMVADVQSWLNSPGSNFGWILRAADESPGITTAREFGSRESLGQEPALTVNFIVPEPGTLGLLGTGVSGLLLRTRRRR